MSVVPLDRLAPTARVRYGEPILMAGDRHSPPRVAIIIDCTCYAKRHLVPWPGDPPPSLDGLAFSAQAPCGCGPARLFVAVAPESREQAVRVLADFRRAATRWYSRRAAGVPV